MTDATITDADGTVRIRGTLGGVASLRIVGPISVVYTQFVNEDDEVTLFTPEAGEWIVKAWGDIATAVPFDDSGSIDFSIAEDPPGPDFNVEAFWQFLGNSIGLAAGNSGPADTDNGNGNGSYSNGTETYSAMREFAGNPVKMRAQSVVGDGTTGALAMFFLIWTP